MPKNRDIGRTNVDISPSSMINSIISPATSDRAFFDVAKKDLVSFMNKIETEIANGTPKSLKRVIDDQYGDILPVNEFNKYFTKDVKRVKNIINDIDRGLGANPGKATKKGDEFEKLMIILGENHNFSKDWILISELPLRSGTRAPRVETVETKQEIKLEKKPVQPETSKNKKIPSNVIEGNRVVSSLAGLKSTTQPIKDTPVKTVRSIPISKPAPKPSTKGKQTTIKLEKEPKDIAKRITKTFAIKESAAIVTSKSRRSGTLEKDLQSFVDETEANIKDIVALKDESPNDVRKTINTHIDKFEIKFNRRYAKLKSNILSNKIIEIDGKKIKRHNLTSSEKNNAIDQLDKIYSKKSLNSIKTTLRGRGEALSEGLLSVESPRKDLARINEGISSIKQKLNKLDKTSPDFNKNKRKLDDSLVSFESQKRVFSTEVESFNPAFWENIKPSQKEIILSDGSKWVRNSGVKDNAPGNFVSSGHDVWHAIDSKGNFKKIGITTIVDGKRMETSEAFDTYKRAATAQKGILDLIGRLNKKIVPKLKPIGDITSTFWSRIKERRPNLDQVKLSKAISQEDRQPEIVMNWITDIRAKQFKDLPEDALKVLNETYSKEVKSNDYIPTSPGSSLFKKFLVLWEKKYSPLKGETTTEAINQLKAVGSSGDINDLVARNLLLTRKARLDEGKIDVSVMDFFTAPLTKIKNIKDVKLKEKAIDDLVRDFVQYYDSVERFTIK